MQTRSTNACLVLQLNKKRWTHPSSQSVSTTCGSSTAAPLVTVAAEPEPASPEPWAAPAAWCRAAGPAASTRAARPAGWARVEGPAAWAHARVPAEGLAAWAHVRAPAASVRELALSPRPVRLARPLGRTREHRPPGRAWLAPPPGNAARSRPGREPAQPLPRSATPLLPPPGRAPAQPPSGSADPALAQPPPPGDATPLARSAGASAAWSAGAQGRAGWPPPLPRKPLEAPPPAPPPPPSAWAQELSASKLFSRSGLSRALLEKKRCSEG